MFHFVVRKKRMILKKSTKSGNRLCVCDAAIVAIG
jgi:hypothetical protein